MLLKENEYLERKNGEYSIKELDAGDIEKRLIEKTKEVINKKIIGSEYEKFKELEKLSEPIIEWLLKNYDPMCKIIIKDGEVEVLRSELKTLPDTKLD